MQLLAGSKGMGKADTQVEQSKGQVCCRSFQLDTGLWGGPFNKKLVGSDVGATIFGRQQAERQAGDLTCVF